MSAPALPKLTAPSQSKLKTDLPKNHHKSKSIKTLNLLFPGTFDPIHLGHLDMLNAAIKALKPDDTFLMPSGKPVHKPLAGAMASHRLAMCQLALEGQPVQLLDIEADNQPHYTIDTLKILHTRYPNCIWALLIGNDAFNQLIRWKSWENLFEYCHFIVVQRNGLMSTPASSTWQALINERSTVYPTQLRKTAAGLIFMLKHSPPGWASRRIRAMIEAHDDHARNALDAKVFAYIQEHHLYVNV